jgi:hypothetical protein
LVKVMAISHPLATCPWASEILACLALLVGVPEVGQAQWTFAGYLGDAWTSSSTMTVDGPAAGTSTRIADVEYETKSWSRPLYWGVRAGRAVSRDERWSLELEYMHLKVFAIPQQVVHVQGTIDGRAVDAREPFQSIVERYQISHGVNLLMINVAYERRINPRLTLTGRTGLGPTLPHAELTIGGVSRDEYTWGRIGAQAGAGVDWSVTGYLFITGELKYTFNSQRLAVGSAMTDARFGTTHLIAGVGMRLPARRVR